MDIFVAPITVTTMILVVIFISACVVVYDIKVFCQQAKTHLDIHSILT